MLAGKGGELRGLREYKLFSLIDVDLEFSA